MVDFKEYPYRPFKKYVNTGKYLKKLGLDWSTISPSGGGPLYLSDYPQDTGSLIDVQSAGFGLGIVQGWVKCTWYIGFKGFKKT